MKKTLIMILISALIFFNTAACSKTTPTQDQPQDSEQDNPEEQDGKIPYENGIYFAAESYFAKNGWKENVTLNLKDGKITDILWNGISIVPAEDKLSTSLAGKYGMVEKGDAKSEWHIQAELTQDYILSTQNIKPAPEFYKDAKGHTDTIAGVTINVQILYNLINDALESGPLKKGNFNDGYPYVELDEDADGWTEKLQYVIVEGNIVDVNYNAISSVQFDKKKNPLDKKIMQDSYEFPGKENSDKAWFQQAVALEEYILENQGFDESIVDTEGYTDKIEGVSMNLNNLKKLTEMLKEKY